MLRRARILLPLLFGCLLCAQTPEPPAQPNPSQPIIILIGPPLSGKTTLAESITRTYGVPNISIEDLIRDNAAELEGLRGEGISLAEMRYDPAISRYVQARLKTADLSHGLVFDGYPATLVQSEDLARMLTDLKLAPIALKLSVPDEVVRKRAKTTGRQSDRARILEQRIKDYHREMDTIALYFPKAMIVTVDADQPEPKVWMAIQMVLDQAGIKPSAK